MAHIVVRRSSGRTSTGMSSDTLRQEAEAGVWNAVKVDTYTLLAKQIEHKEFSAAIFQQWLE